MTLDVAVRRRFTATGADPFDVDVELAVEAGETLVVLGPSGSGKTLLLECIGGFHAHAGHVRLDDRDLTDEPPERRDFGFVFQDYALFPHRTVRENVAFGAPYHDEPRDPDAVLDELGVGDLADRTPPTLSGGEAQRVALARSLAIRPDAMLLDEPLSALDVPTRESLRDDLDDVLADVTAVYVTHNRTTARALADRIAVMRDGHVVQVGTPPDVFERPATRFVASFTGSNCLDTALIGEDGGGTVAIRPEHVRLHPTGVSSEGGGEAGSETGTEAGTGDFAARVVRVVREDATCRVTLSTGNDSLTAYTSDPPGVGETVGVSLPTGHCVYLAEDGEEDVEADGEEDVEADGVRSRRFRRDSRT